MGRSIFKVESKIRKSVLSVLKKIQIYIDN